MVTDAPASDLATVHTTPNIPTAVEVNLATQNPPVRTDEPASDLATVCPICDTRGAIAEADYARSFGLRRTNFPRLATAEATVPQRPPASQVTFSPGASRTVATTAVDAIEGQDAHGLSLKGLDNDSWIEVEGEGDEKNDDEWVRV